MMSSGVSPSTSTLFRLSSVAVAALCTSPPAARAESLDASSIDARYNENEARGSFEMVMKPYPIPVQTTTYVDFMFNFPDDVPDLFHVVFGEVIDSHPEHLHHFVLAGCTSRIDPSQEGLPVGREARRDCTMRLGGWAPGVSLFGNADTDTGRLMGRGLGIEAVLMNVHYTDGEYEDAAAMTHKMATDGIRVHYTPDFRPYSSRAKNVIDVGTGAKTMVIPPGEPRFYLTRTCKVDTSCKDWTPEQMERMMRSMGREDMAQGREVSCASVKPLCGMEGGMGSWVRRMCPAACGFCEKTLLDGAPNPLNPESYRVTAVNYHAHILGREMYATLLHDEVEEAADVAVAARTQAQPQAPTTTTIVKDLKSQEFWIYDYQETFPIDYDIARDDAIMKGSEVRPGDRIQVTCVYDSTGRDKDTSFSISTYDEMCITRLFVTFETPASLLEGTSEVKEGGPGLAAELSLLAFDCEDGDEETAMHVGTLAEGEDARNIWRDHPIGDAVGCTFPHSRLGPRQRGVRCPSGIAVEGGGEELPSSSSDLDQELELEQAQQGVSPERLSSSTSSDLDQEPELEQAQQEVSSAAPIFAVRGVVLAVLICGAAVVPTILL